MTLLKLSILLKLCLCMMDIANIAMMETRSCRLYSPTMRIRESIMQITARFAVGV